MASTPPAADSEIQPETVEVLLATVKGLVDAENTRSESFNSRGSGVAGFAGIVVSVSAAAGPKVLSKDVGDAVRWVAAALLAVALAAMLVAVSVVVFRVLWPRSSTTLSMSEIRRYPTYESVNRAPVMVQGSLLGAYVEMLAVERDLADGKSKALRVAYVALAVGIGAIAVLAATLGVNELGVS